MYISPQHKWIASATFSATSSHNSSVDVYLAELLKVWHSHIAWWMRRRQMMCWTANFILKTLPSIKPKVCTYCSIELSFHRSTTSLIYHLFRQSTLLLMLAKTLALSHVPQTSLSARASHAFPYSFTHIDVFTSSKIYK